MAQGSLAAVMHLESAEAIDPKFHMLDVLHTAGLRSLGPVWSRPNAFGQACRSVSPKTPTRAPASPASAASSSAAATRSGS